MLLLIEVADSSLRFDREVRVPLYARHLIPEVWLLDLKHKRLEVYRDPGPEGHRQVLLPDRGQRIAPLALPEVEIAVADLW
ncbi:MAG: Uma2 family endonuclease [Thiohalocapsa sp.]|uniref:Uma2 family endonuclease n=1 Tax=Thiohalocapsa sp. TaxID=2497641 RepID=UPI0025F84564|nr:Uma2 family endonuclease [Thiohalocapsa sp.]MCG6939734.1 Uma2 family endonuclease [Thiohalocapsa sp.]